MGHIQRERLPKSKIASSDNDRFTLCLYVRQPDRLFRPVAGGGAGGPRAPPEMFRLE